MINRINCLKNLYAKHLIEKNHRVESQMLTLITYGALFFIC